MKIDFQVIYVDQNIEKHQDWYLRDQSIINRFPHAEIKLVESHSRIEELRNSNPEQWIQTKQNYLVLGVRKSLTSTPNNNSSDFIAPGSSRGCLSACSYCYVARHTRGSNPLTARIRSINNLVEHGYEVHVNFSPIVIYDGEQWRHDWVQLWSEMNDVLTPQAKAQLKAEAFFLTHSADLHQVNLQWTPQGEDYLWQPEIQQAKVGKSDVLCYRYDIKQTEVKRFKNGLRKFLPYCELRYIF